MRLLFAIAAAVALALLLVGCSGPAKEAVEQPLQQDVIKVPAAAAADNSTNITIREGCSYSNPPCNASYDCANNSCVLKGGCDYNNPGCGLNHTCTGNVCVLKSGCRYNNPQCNSSQVCQNNKCFEHILSSGGGGY